MQTLAIPRGQVALAAGHAQPDADEIVVTATRGNTEYGICSTEFLETAFCTDSYSITITFYPDGSWSYVTDTELMVEGRDAPFAHQDRNTRKSRRFLGLGGLSARSALVADLLLGFWPAQVIMVSSPLGAHSPAS